MNTTDQTNTKSGAAVAAPVDRHVRPAVAGEAQMLRALQNILLAVSGLLFCWIAPLYATYDALRRDRGTFIECQRREWARWWSVYEDLRA